MNNYKPTFEINDFVDDNFVDFYDEELVYDYFKERFKDDLLVKVLSKEVVPDGFSRLGTFDVDDECFYTSRDSLTDVNYDIKPDYDPISLMFDNFDKYNSGYRGAYEYVPTANPIVPINKYVSGDDYHTLEDVMISKGFKILDPTPGQSSKCDDDNSVSYKDDLSGTYFDKYCLKINSKAAQKDAVIVGLQFNPFNPRSAKLIQQLTWESETECYGSYKYREKIYQFRYDLKSKYYRYHADVWMKMFSIPNSIQNHYQSYDMISVKRFCETMPCIGDSLSKVFNNIFLEPISTSRDVVGKYSVIGPWEGDIRRGIANERFFVPYLTQEFELDYLSGYKRYKILTNFKITFDEFYDRDLDLRFKFRKGKIYSDKYYCRSTAGSYAVLREDSGGDRKMYRLPFKMKNEYHNYNSSVVEHFRTISIMNYISDISKMMSDRSLNGAKWATQVEELGDIYKLKVKDEIVLDQTEPVDLKITKIVKERVGKVSEKLRDKRVLKVEIKTEEEKKVAAIRSHIVGEDFKNAQMKVDYNSVDKKLRNNLNLGKRNVH